VKKEWRPVVKMLQEACKRPCRQILKNADLDSEKILTETLKNDDIFWGFNVVSGNYSDLYSEGVIDPVKVTKTALNNSCSVALLLTNTDAIVAEKPDNPSSWQPPAGWRPPADNNLNHKY